MSLRAQPRAGEPDDYDVLHGRLEIGRVYKRAATASPEAQWIWSVNGLVGLPRDLAIAGISATHEEAMAALNEAWAKWLAWANLKEKD
jgi:hypothetical protein